MAKEAREPTFTMCWVDIDSFEKANWGTAATVDIVPAQRRFGESNAIATLFAGEIDDGVIGSTK